MEPLLDAGDAPGYHQPLSAGPPLYKAVDDEANDRPGVFVTALDGFSNAIPL